MYSFAPGKKARLLTFMHTERVNPHDYWLLEEIGLCSHMPRTEALRRSVNSSETFEDPSLRLCEQEAEVELAALLDRRLLMLVDERALRGIRHYLARDESSEGPACGLPAVGDIDFTPRGADLYMRMHRDVFDVSLEKTQTACLDEIDAKHIQVYGTVRAVVAELFYDSIFRFYDWVGANDILQIRSWRDRWWRKFPRGWRLDVEVDGFRDLA